MPNIRSQIVNSSSIHIVASDGRSITLTKQKIRNLTRRDLPDKAAAIAHVKREIQDALGAEQVPVSLLEFDFDESDGTPLRLSIGRLSKIWLT